MEAQPYNMPLLDAMLEKRVRLVDYECIREGMPVWAVPPDHNQYCPMHSAGRWEEARRSFGSFWTVGWNCRLSQLPEVLNVCFVHVTDLMRHDQLATRSRRETTCNGIQHPFSRFLTCLCSVLRKSRCACLNFAQVWHPASCIQTCELRFCCKTSCTYMQHPKGALRNRCGLLENVEIALLPMVHQHGRSSAPEFVQHMAGSSHSLGTSVFCLVRSIGLSGPLNLDGGSEGSEHFPWLLSRMAVDRHRDAVCPPTLWARQGTPPELGPLTFAFLGDGKVSKGAQARLAEQQMPFVNLNGIWTSLSLNSDQSLDV
eukprot:4020415-Amphidinium_carterae.1